MKIDELISLVVDRLTSEKTSDQEGSFHRVVIRKWLNLAYEQILQQAIEEAEAKNNFGLLDVYSKRFKNVPVYYDVDTEEYYSTLPATIFNFRRFNGIRLISPMHDQSNAFIYRSSVGNFVMSDMECDYVSSRTRFKPENGKVFYEYIDPMITKVLMKLIVTIDSFSERDDVPIPNGKGLELVTIAINMMLNRPRADQASDNQSTLTNRG